MLSRDRRLGFRVPVDLFINQYIAERPFRALAQNISDCGIFTNRVASTPSSLGQVVGLEFELPGTGETIWARGEVCYFQRDNYFRSNGIRFTGIPRVHAKLVRDYCIESRRAHLGRLLERIRNPRR